MEWAQVGRWLLLLGLGIALLGGILILVGRARQDGWIPWLGNLPGDIRIEGKGVSCYFPLVTSILLSLLLTIILNVIIRLFRR